MSNHSEVVLALICVCITAMVVQGLFFARLWHSNLVSLPGKTSPGRPVTPRGANPAKDAWGGRALTTAKTAAPHRTAQNQATAAAKCPFGFGAADSGPPDQSAVSSPSGVASAVNHSPRGPPADDQKSWLHKCPIMVRNHPVFPTLRGFYLPCVYPAWFFPTLLKIWIHWLGDTLDVGICGLTRARMA